MRKGFTLIELMIVVAIIAVIAAIAIPNLLASKMASNETAAIACLRTWLGAQNQFHRTDYYGNNYLVYANNNSNGDGDKGLPDLYECKGITLKLIDRIFAGAAAQHDNKPRAGYVFDDLTGAADDYDYAIDCGLSGAPKEFARSGRNKFVIDVTGVVYMKMLIAQEAPQTTYGDASSWIPVGSD